MATFTFYNEIQISECPSNLFDLKQTIKQLYHLDDEQVNKSLISYYKDHCHFYIFTEEQFQQVKLIIESVIIRIELSDIDNYFNIEPIIDEEYSVFKFEKDEKKESPNEKEEIIEENNFGNKNMPLQEENEKAKEKSQEVNHIIKCNLCKKKIRGIRYLCGICKKFNICKKCETKEGQNHGHSLLKIRSPDLAPILFKYKLKKKRKKNNFKKNE